VAVAPEAGAPIAAETSRRMFDVRRMGRVGYGEALELQARLVEERRRGELGDTILLLEHPPVITLGVKTRGKSTNIVASAETLAAEGVSVFETGRGGDITYHGPGQLVGYPILDLRPDRCDVHHYVRDLEAVLIQAIGEFGIEGRRVDGLTGVWVGPKGREEKIAAIGIRISRWITSHGFALNVATDLRHFRLIVPCGIADRGVTSIERVLAARAGANAEKKSLPMIDVEDAVVRAFDRVFNA
jgi:lipoyl(octanoyl) transferase